MSIKGFNEIVNLWISKNSLPGAAIELTLEQVDEFESIVKENKLWNGLIEIFRRGRVQDPWLASDWPAGFDELVLCAPLCKLVDWECAMCNVGKKQNNFSCANDDSLFGYIAVLLALENRDLLLNHLSNVKLVLQNKNVFWDMKKHEIYINSSYSSDNLNSVYSSDELKPA